LFAPEKISRRRSTRIGVVNRHTTTVDPALFRVGDYVLATKFGDADLHDRWAVGFVSEVLDNYERVLIETTGQLSYGAAAHVSGAEGAALLDAWRDAFP
jgi:hypothetical protein